MGKQNYLIVLAGTIQCALRTGAAFVAALLLAVAFAGCASARGQVFHSFEFDVPYDSPGITLLNYKYGTSNVPVTAPPAWMLSTGEMRQRGSVTGAMPVGESLFVKWRINATGEVVEQTVDLRNRLPKDMTNHTIYFAIKDRELFVYVATPELRKSDHPTIGPNKLKYYKVLQVSPPV